MLHREEKRPLLKEGLEKLGGFNNFGNLCEVWIEL
jgi:hypothetical protein